MAQDSGLLKALANGSVSIKATAKDASGVSGIADIIISGQTILVASVTLTSVDNITTINEAGGHLQLTSLVFPANATNKNVTWSVTNGTGSATVSESGLLTAISNGTVTAKATAKDGSAKSGTLIITINFCMPISKPVISASFLNPSAPVLTSNSVNGNQWYLNGNAIKDATDRSYTVVQPGIYAVQVILGKCVSSLSEPITILVTEIEKDNSSPIVLYPNPATNAVTLLASIDRNAETKVTIKDAQGRVCYSGGRDSINQEIDISNYAGGVYLVEIVVGAEIQVRKFLKFN
jgi:hypothetical protein